VTEERKKEKQAGGGRRKDRDSCPRREREDAGRPPYECEEKKLFVTTPNGLIIGETASPEEGLA